MLEKNSESIPGSKSFDSVSVFVGFLFGTRLFFSGFSDLLDLFDLCDLEDWADVTDLADLADLVDKMFCPVVRSTGWNPMMRFGVGNMFTKKARDCLY
jgi:hypothetical protein